MTRLKAFLAAILVGTAALAHQGVTNPAVKARMDAMSASAKALETIGTMAKGSVAFDAQGAATAKTALLAAAAKTPELFQMPETDPKSEALPKIWTEFPRFQALSEATVASIERLDTSSADGLREGLGRIGQSCAACHESFRIDN